MVPGPLLVLGVGNVLLRDEGVGVRVCEVLQRAVAEGRVELPAGTEIVDGGTLGLDLLPQIEDAGALVIVDAADLRQAPGAVAVLRGDALSGALAGYASPNQVGLGELLATARLAGRLPDPTVLVGVQPGEISVGLELTEPVLAALPVAIAAIVDELRSMAR